MVAITRFFRRGSVELFLKSCMECQTRKKKPVSGMIDKPVVSKKFGQHVKIDLIDPTGAPE